MHIVFLRFGENRSNAGEFMSGHNAWIKQGFDDGVFMLAGSIEPGQGGSIIAHNVSTEELKKRLDDDPFVSEKVVEVEIVEISPKKTDERLNFLAN